jgi:hypothetical protein
MSGFDLFAGFIQPNATTPGVKRRPHNAPRQHRQRAAFAQSRGCRRRRHSAAGVDRYGIHLWLWKHLVCCDKWRYMGVTHVHHSLDRTNPKAQYGHHGVSYMEMLVWWWMSMAQSKDWRELPISTEPKRTSIRNSMLS